MDHFGGGELCPTQRAILPAMQGCAIADLDNNGAFDLILSAASQVPGRATQRRSDLASAMSMETFSADEACAAARALVFDAG